MYINTACSGRSMSPMPLASSPIHLKYTSSAAAKVKSSPSKRSSSGAESVFSGEKPSVAASGLALSSLRIEAGANSPVQRRYMNINNDFIYSGHARRDKRSPQGNRRRHVQCYI